MRPATSTDRRRKSIVVKRMGGRQYNYDFEIMYPAVDDTETSVVKMEFKYNCKSMFNLPQLIQVTDNKLITIGKDSYAEYFYDNYLEQLCNTVGVEKCKDKEYYLKNVYKIIPNGFFKILKGKYNTPEYKGKGCDIVNLSIKTYLEKVATLEDVSNEFLKNIAVYIPKSLNKTYMLWDCDTSSFIVERLFNEGEQFKFITDSYFKNNNKLIVEKTNKLE